MISAALRVVPAEVRTEADLIAIEEDVMHDDVFGGAVGTVARSVVLVSAVDVDAAWWLTYNALADEFLHDVAE